MGRDVEINIPMFIGIILLVAIITAVLVFGVNKAKELMTESNHDYSEGANTIESWFNRNTLENEQANVDSTNLIENSNIINELNI